MADRKKFKYGSNAREVYGTNKSPGRYDVEIARPSELKKMSRGQYRDYMAQRQRVQDVGRKEAEHRARKPKDFTWEPRDKGGTSRDGDEFTGRPAKRYYKSFDRGAARYAKRSRGRKRSKTRRSAGRS